MTLSKFPVGSSAKRMAGSFTRARASAARCCSPPESSLGRCSLRAPSRTRSSACATRRLRSARSTSRQPQWEARHFFFQSHSRQQVEGLKHHAHGFAAITRQPLGIERGQILSANMDCAGSRPVQEPAIKIQQGGLTRTGAAEQGQKFAAAEFPAEKIVDRADDRFRPSLVVARALTCSACIRVCVDGIAEGSPIVIRLRTPANFRAPPLALRWAPVARVAVPFERSGRVGNDGWP